MKIHVLGLGETLEDFTPDGSMTIGVNDIHSRVKTDFVVCVDNPKAFNKERLKTIRETECEGFYTHVEDWKSVKNYKPFEMASIRGRLDELDSEKFCYSTSSPFVACVLAYKMGAKQIVLWGVDYMSHQAFKDHRRDTVLRHFKDLQKEFNKRGVELFVGDSFSYLSTFLPVWNDKN